MNKENLINNILNETGAKSFCLCNSNYDERLAYVSMVTSLAWADGSIDDRERELIESIAKAAGNDIEEQLEIIFSETKRFNLARYDTWVENITTEPLKIALMVDMFLTSFADTICMQSESIYMKYIAGKLGISDGIYNIIRRNVEEYLNDKNTNVHLSYERGVAHKDEVEPETEEENNLRNIFNGILKTLIMAI